MLHPAYAIMGDDLPRLRAAYSKLLQLTGILSLPTAAVLGLCADRLVPLLWRPQWTASILLVYALLPGAAVQPLAAVAWRGTGPGLMLWVTVFNAVVLLEGMALGVRWGAGWPGATRSRISASRFRARAWRCRARVLHGTLRELVAWLWRPLATFAIVMAAGLAARVAISSAPPLAGPLVIAAAALLAWGLAVRALAWPLVLSVAPERAAEP